MCFPIQQIFWEIEKSKKFFSYKAFRNEELINIQTLVKAETFHRKDVV